MVGLVDLVRAAETVEVLGEKIQVYGVSARGIAYLLGRFPELRAMMSGVVLDEEQLRKMGGDVVAAIISAGCGTPNDEEAEKAAALLSADVQADLLKPILKLTMPKGVGPFVEKLTALGSVLGAEVSAEVPVTKLAKRLKN